MWHACLCLDFPPGSLLPRVLLSLFLYFIYFFLYFPLPLFWSNIPFGTRDKEKESYSWKKNFWNRLLDRKNIKFRNDVAHKLSRISPLANFELSKRITFAIFSVLTLIINNNNNITRVNSKKSNMQRYTMYSFRRLESTASKVSYE